jgi:NTP pyrophosphatase (non-canonical NTP hydrolase)
MLHWNNLRAAKLVAQAATRWGEKNQALICVGEMAELTSKITQKHVQERELTDFEIMEEIADAAITLATLSTFYPKEALKATIELKLNKLESKL